MYCINSVPMTREPIDYFKSINNIINKDSLTGKKEQSIRLSGTKVQ